MEVELPIMLPKYWEERQVWEKLWDIPDFYVVEGVSWDRFLLISRRTGRIGLMNILRSLMRGLGMGREYMTATGERIWVPIGHTVSRILRREGVRVEELRKLNWGGGAPEALEAWDWEMMRMRRGLEYIDNITLHYDIEDENWFYDDIAERYYVRMMGIIYIWSGHGYEWFYGGGYLWCIPLDP